MNIEISRLHKEHIYTHTQTTWYVTPFIPNTYRRTLYTIVITYGASEELKYAPHRCLMSSCAAELMSLAKAAPNVKFNITTRVSQKDETITQLLTIVLYQLWLHLQLKQFIQYITYLFWQDTSSSSASNMPHWFNTLQWNLIYDVCFVYYSHI